MSVSWLVTPYILLFAQKSPLFFSILPGFLVTLKQHHLPCVSSLATSTGTQLTKEHCSPMLSPAPAQAPATLFNSLVCDGYTANCAHNKHMCKLLASSLSALNTQTIVCLFQPVTWQAILNIGHQYPFPALQPFPALTMILIMYRALHGTFVSSGLLGF